MRVLVVEDDPELLRIIRDVFEDEAFLTDGEETGDDGLYAAEQMIHDLIVLDVMLPGMSGIEIVKRLRERSIGVPIILLTAKDSVEDLVNGLNAGADDYVTKPFAVAELLARARAVLRRRGALGAEGEVSCGVVRLVPSERDGYAGGQPLRLTAKEYELLEFLLCNQERILTRDQIFDRIWGFESDAATTAVDVYVHHLRKKLEAHDADGLIRTVRGIGYMVKGENHVP
ncbi:DNA-binding response regulator [Paenibacillus sp. CCS19]|uniref:response regulator transcription factor n=1 Tax=Paenibacillus sp. CCS19 TaxID=3158387 RepID=UPI00255DD51B|nr:response regulator transcription factor [Paenibacillus cellulosilyticus]GMK40305.1 DNA-binding response regulator [Paenibacillus cellulosilyticus]